MNHLQSVLIGLAISLISIEGYRLFEERVSEEKIVFLKDAKGATSQVVNLSPTGILCISVTELAKQVVQPKK